MLPPRVAGHAQGEREHALLEALDGVAAQLARTTASVEANAGTILRAAGRSRRAARRWTRRARAANERSRRSRSPPATSSPSRTRPAARPTGSEPCGARTSGNRGTSAVHQDPLCSIAEAARQPDALERHDRRNPRLVAGARTHLDEEHEQGARFGQGRVAGPLGPSSPGDPARGTGWRTSDTRKIYQPWSIVGQISQPARESNDAFRGHPRRPQFR